MLCKNSDGNEFYGVFRIWQVLDLGLEFPNIFSEESCPGNNIFCPGNSNPFISNVRP